jgi:hypothetical protein
MYHYPDWDMQVLKECYHSVDYISMHHYQSVILGDIPTYMGASRYFEDYINTEIALCDFMQAKLKSDKKMMLSEGWTQEDKLWRFNPCILIYSVGLDIKSIDRPKFNTWYSDGNQPLFVYRSGFDDSNDVYLGVKGGYPKQGHSHMDSGAFYYERDGVIWSGDLGSDSYLLPGSDDSSQIGGRWDLFRCGLLSHSTIWFDDTEHIVTAKTNIKECFDDERIGVIVDLTAACANKVSYAERKVYLEEDELHVIDEIIPLSATTVTWNMLTGANAEITKASMIMLCCIIRKLL